MSRHEGVTCDVCMKSHFKKKRFKCLICYDYDLCSNCQEDGRFSAQHTKEHPMQCILTRNDINLYFGGDITGGHPEAYTCPHCGNMGFNLTSLFDHVTNEHSNLSSAVVICPVCAVNPVSQAAVSRQDLLRHLRHEHRNPTRVLSAFFDEPPLRQSARRIASSTRGSSRGRRTHVHFSATGPLSADLPLAESITPFNNFFAQLSESSHPHVPVIGPLIPDRHARTREKTILRINNPIEVTINTPLFDKPKNPNPADTLLLIPKILAQQKLDDNEFEKNKIIRCARRNLAEIVILASSEPIDMKQR